MTRRTLKKRKKKRKENQISVIEMEETHNGK